MTYFDRNGQPIPRARWKVLRANPVYGLVAQDLLANGWIVQTLWTGENFSGATPPLVFRTAIFRDLSGPIEWFSWTTEQAARLGHLSLVIARTQNLRGAWIVGSPA